jgi:formate hydrogenlyase subunit 4
MPLWSLGSSFAALALLLVSAPFVPGVASRTKSILTGRRGPPAWQLYADLWKLARRGVVYSTSTTWIFRAAPVVLVATTVMASALLPLDGRRAVLPFTGDAVAFAYLLALGRFALVLAAMDTGSSFEGMGASREVTFATLVEPGLFVALAALAISSRELTLTTMLGENVGRWPTIGPSLVMLATSLFALSLAECARVPVDDPDTHLELTMVHEVMVLDHSGPDLAMIMYAHALKLGVFAAIVLDVVQPGRRPGGLRGLLALSAALVGFGVAIGLVESLVARLRFPKIPLYIAAGSAIGLFGLILLLR